MLAGCFLDTISNPIICHEFVPPEFDDETLDEGRM